MKTIIDTLTLPLKHACFYLGDAPDAWQAWYEDKDWTCVTLKTSMYAASTQTTIWAATRPPTS